MSLQTVVESLNTSGQLERLCRRASPAHWQDLAQEVNIILLTDPSPERIIEMAERGELKYWIIKVIRNQAQSDSGPFYRENTFWIKHTPINEERLRINNELF